MAADNSIGNLYIADDDYLGSAQAYLDQAQKADELLEEFVAATQKLRDEGSLEGETADCLFMFMDAVSAALRGQVAVLVGAHRQHMEAYIDEIDTADDVLYGG